MATRPGRVTKARNIWAVVPVKELAGAKSRLAEVCSPEIRCQLVRAMAEDVLSVLASVPELSGIAVVTLDLSIATLAVKYGAQVFADGARDSYSGAVAAAAARLDGAGCDGILVLPADIPLITAGEISAVIAAHRAAPALTIVQAHDGRGSNAVMVSPPGAVPFAFGETSFCRHVENARRLGIEPTMLTLPGIRFDIDNAADLALFMQRPSGTLSWACLTAHGVTPQTAVAPIVPQTGSA